MIDGGTGDMERAATRARLGRDPLSLVPSPTIGEMVEVSMSLGLELLSELRAALVELEISSQVREDVAALAVSTDAPGVYLWVFVSFSDRYFSWARGNHQHPVNDIPGAARRIATHVEGLHLLGGGEC